MLARRASFARWFLRGVLRIRPLDDRTIDFDAKYNVDTSGFIPSWLLHSGEGGAYLGCHTGSLRLALDAIPLSVSYAFYDVGCGKGRAAVIATEYPFRAIVGIELSPMLAKIAKRNAETINQCYPDRKKIEIITLNATEFLWPPGDKIVFMYHPFGEAVVSKVIEDLLAATQNDNLFIIYGNPVYAARLDGDLQLSRWYASRMTESPETQALAEALVVWSNRTAKELGCVPLAGRDEPIRVIKPGQLADLVSGPTSTTSPLRGSGTRTFST
jgi:SAM-dependent methyltransferase